jgi:hypothetical protein
MPPHCDRNGQARDRGKAMSGKLESILSNVIVVPVAIVRATGPAVAIALLTLCVAIFGGVATVVGQSPTPTDRPTSSPSPAATSSPTATPAPEPTPHPQTTITIRFVRSGQPATVAIVPSQTAVLVGETPGPQLVDCSQSLAIPAANVSEYEIAWPLPLNQGFAADCTKGPPTTLHISFVTATRHLAPFGTVVTWMGSDLTFDLEVPAHIPVISPATAIPSPASVPSTGGRPTSGGGSLWAMLLAAAVAILVSTTLLVGQLTRRLVIQQMRNGIPNARRSGGPR